MRIDSTLRRSTIDKAIKFDPQAGTITISTKNTEFFGELVSIQLVVDQTLTKKFDKLMLQLDFVDGSNIDDLPEPDPFEPIPLMTRILSADAAAVVGFTK